MADYEPRIVCFSCKFGWGYLSDQETLASRVKNWIPVICSGRVDSTHVLDAFEQGADGVLILGCPEGDCHFQDGNFETRRKTYMLRQVMESYGIEGDRLKMEMSTDPGGESIPQLVRTFGDSLARLGPVKRA